MLPNKFKKPPPNRVLRLNNATCPYCGVELTPDNVSKEHVIGRNFVPKGTLDRQWNLIVRACNKCNSAKADLEDDISAITLAGRVWFGSRDCDELVLKAAQRKSEKSISRKTGKLVKHSREELNFEVPFATGATFNFNCITPPQTESFRLFELACPPPLD